MMRLLPLAVLALAAAPASAAERNYSVTSFDRIRVEGPFAVRLVTGRAPFAKAVASPQGLDGVTAEVSGRTLIIRPNRAAWGGYPGQQRGPVELSVGTHNLTHAVLNGSGALAIDKVKGLAFDLVIQGAGTASIEEAAVDRLSTGIMGAGSARLGGKALKFSALVQGTSALDAGELEARDAVIGAEGPATVRAMATVTATITARGLAAVTLGGSPACKVKAEGSATVSGCR